MNRYLKLLFVFLLFVALALVRFFETEIFYDPFIEFYKSEYLNASPPFFKTEKLLLNVGFRYWLNTFLSLLIIFVAFLDRNILKFAVLFYLFMFFVLIGIFLLLLKDLGQENYMNLFYVRRFLIQPIFVLLLLPAFYYQKLKKTTDF